MRGGGAERFHRRRAAVVAANRLPRLSGSARPAHRLGVPERARLAHAGPADGGVSHHHDMRTQEIDSLSVHHHSPVMDQSIREWQATKARSAFAEIIDA